MDEHTQLMHFLKGDLAAVAFCESLFQISQVWDDLIDGDPVSPEDINKTFWRCLVELPTNPFYEQHRNELNPLVRQYIIDWFDANTLEREGDHEQDLAFVLRDSIGAVVIHCALLIGGFGWMRTVSADIRKMIHDESLKDYKEGLDK